MVMFFGESGTELGDCDPLCKVVVPPRAAAGYVDVHVDHPTGGTGEYTPGFFYATACVAAGTMVTPDGTCVEVRGGWVCDFVTDDCSLTNARTSKLHLVISVPRWIQVPRRRPHSAARWILDARRALGCASLIGTRGRVGLPFDRMFIHSPLPASCFRCL